MTTSVIPAKAGISLIVATAQNRVIGIRNDLPWHLPADLKRFKALTTGKPVIMGRKTFESIFERIKKPLPDRPNIVISRSGFTHDGVAVYEDLKEALEATAKNYSNQEIMVIGGASIYEQALPLADRLYLTIIQKDYDGDAWFPEIKQDEWKSIEEQTFEDPMPYKNVTLDRV